MMANMLLLLFIKRNINGEIEGVAVIANEVTPQALANINLKKAKNVSGPYLIMCLYTHFNEPNEEASISYWNKTGWITQAKF
jgi:hypothetical protein